MTPFINALIEYATKEAFLIPLVASVVLQIAGPARFKHLLKSGENIPALSVIIGFGSFVVLRTLMIYKQTGDWSAVDIAIDSIVAMVIISLVPWIYSTLLPKSFQDKYSYSAQVQKRRKTIQTQRGFKQVDEDYKTDPNAGERTVIPAGEDGTQFLDVGDPTERPDDKEGTR